MLRFKELAAGRMGTDWPTEEVGMVLRAAFLPKPAASQKRKGRRMIVAPSLQLAPSPLGSEGEEEQGLSGQDDTSLDSPSPVAKRAKKSHSPRGASSEDSEQKASPSPALKRLSTLSRIQPPNVSKLEAARTLFGDETLQQAAKVRAVPTRIEKEEMKPLEFRYDLALRRLIAQVGDGWLKRRPRSMLDLRMMREEVIDLISQPSPTTKERGSDKRERDAPPPRSDSDSEEGSSRARFIALTPELQARAVSSGVARRLHN